MAATIPDQGLYIFMLSIHGLVRDEAPELGRDADTGGQVTYVLELTRALAFGASRRSSGRAADPLNQGSGSQLRLCSQC